MPIQEINYGYANNIGAGVLFPPNTIGFGEVEALQKMCSTFPIRHDIAY